MFFHALESLCSNNSVFSIYSDASPLQRKKKRTQFEQEGKGFPAKKKKWTRKEREFCWAQSWAERKPRPEHRARSAPLPVMHPFKGVLGADTTDTEATRETELNYEL